MTITAIGSRGTGFGNASSTSVSMQPTPATGEASSTIPAGHSLLLLAITDNDFSAVATGVTNRHQSVTDGVNPWTKLGEYTHSPTGAVADGITASVWLCNLGAPLINGTITLNQAQATVDKAMSLYEFSTTAGGMMKVGSPDFQVMTGANDFGSSSLSGFSSAPRLWFRGMGKEVNTTTAMTPTSGFTAITQVRSRLTASTFAITAFGEFKIATSTGETSNPSLAVVGDTSGVFCALIEGTSPPPPRPQVFCCT